MMTMENGNWACSWCDADSGIPAENTVPQWVACETCAMTGHACMSDNALAGAGRSDTASQATGAIDRVCLRRRAAGATEAGLLSYLRRVREVWSQDRKSVV
jgi:hypothetical protein